MRLRPEEAEVVREAAAADGITVSELIRVALRRYVLELRRRGTLG